MEDLYGEKKKISCGKIGRSYKTDQNVENLITTMF